MELILKTKAYGVKAILIDDEDYNKICNFKWHICKHGMTYYARANILINGKWTSLSIHRCILKPDPKYQIDHIDGNGLNNQRSNMRICTNSQNQMNTKKESNNTSGFKGVSFKKDISRGNIYYYWYARICLNGKSISIGRFKTPEEAHAAYYEAAKKYHGEFANAG